MKSLLKDTFKVGQLVSGNGIVEVNTTKRHPKLRELYMIIEIIENVGSGPVYFYNGSDDLKFLKKTIKNVDGVYVVTLTNFHEERQGKFLFFHKYFFIQKFLPPAKQTEIVSDPTTAVV